MSDNVDSCANCGRFIGLDEHFEEERNEYGYPVAVCDQCSGRDLGSYLPPGYC